MFLDWHIGGVGHMIEFEVITVLNGGGVHTFSAFSALFLDVSTKTAEIPLVHGMEDFPSASLQIVALGSHFES